MDNAYRSKADIKTRVYEGPLIAEAVEELRILKMLIFRPEAVILKSAFR